MLARGTWSVLRHALLLTLVAVTDGARPPARGIPKRTPTTTGKRPATTPSTKPSLNSLFSFLAEPPPPPPPPRFFGFGSSPLPPPPPRFAVDNIVEVAKDAVSAIKPLQVFSGFALAVVLFSSAVGSTINVVSDFLNEDDNGVVLERTLKFGTILENVKEAYVDTDIDLDKMFQTGVNSMLQLLDPYSEYENAEQADELQLRTTGRYGGVGLTIGKDDKENILVLGALEGYAYDAGVRPGDRIVSVNDKPVKSLSTDAVKNLLRGEPGTAIELTVQRDGSTEKTLSMRVPRKLVRLPDVSLALVRDGVGYIKLDGFSEGTASEVARAISKMQEQGGIASLVLDMRDNPGGLLDAAVAVSQQLVPEGTEIVSTAGRAYAEGNSVSYRSARPPLLNPKTRLVVLVNSNTASAAEIVTGVVQDTDRGVVVGERTYGKGLVQVVEPLPGGGSLKLTVAKYYTPSGRCIQAVSYGGGRLEASAKKGGAAGVTDLKAGSATGGTALEDDALAPAAPPLIPPVGDDGVPVEVTKSEPKKGTTAGMVMRIDPTDPSRPRDASSDEKDVVYMTEHGRAVKAGGGIAPDVIVEGRELGELERSLLQRGYFFDFAGDYLKRHAAPADVLAVRVETQREEAYREFVAFARTKAAEKEGSIEPAIIKRQLDLLEKSIGKQGATGASRERTLKELGVLRKQLQEDQFLEFTTQKSALQDDLVDSMLGRLTPPSVRLAMALDKDPQITAALALAKDEAKYAAMLAPDPSLPADAKRTADGLPVRKTPLVDAKPTARVFPQDESDLLTMQ